MDRKNKIEYYLDIAIKVSERSTCLKRHYGAVIVRNDEIIATGYNGSPRGCTNCIDFGDCLREQEGNHVANDGNYGSCRAVHAEQNAMISASRKDMIDSVLYLYGEKDVCNVFGDITEIVNPTPCPICARMLLNAGIKFFINNTGIFKVKDFI